MPKVKMTALDVRASCAALAVRLVGLRVRQVYDISDRIYLFKMEGIPEAKLGAPVNTGTPEHPDVSVSNRSRAVLLISSGERMHTTNYVREKSNSPSPFVVKLRKHLRNKRLIAVTQAGIDRVVDMQFGSSTSACHLIHELHSGGNLILTDADYHILIILRTAARDARVFVRDVYSFASCTSLPDKQLTTSEISTAFDKSLAEVSHQSEGVISVAEVLASLTVLGPTIVSEAMISAGLSPKTNICTPLESSIISQLCDALNRERLLLDDAGLNRLSGYIIGDRNMSSESEALSYYDFSVAPTRKQWEGQNKGSKIIKCFSDLDLAMDEYFSRSEEVMAERKASKREETGVQKLAKATREIDARSKGLWHSAKKSGDTTALIELYIDDVQACLDAVNSALAAGTDWPTLSSALRDAKSAGAGIASIIHSLRLEHNKIVLQLEEPADVDDRRGINHVRKSSPLLVELDLSLSAHANACKIYELRRNAISKAERTDSNRDEALKSITAKLAKDATLSRGKKLTAAPKVARKVYWFEKFHWFISSEGFIVVLGKDAQQNEQLVKKYLSKGDAYVHADLHGASSCVVKGIPESDCFKRGHAPPPLTLAEAGHACICRSAGWDNKIVTSAWWVHPHQVSKTAPTGEYLTTGSFMIRGKKNYLPPGQLIMGYSFLFRVADECRANHAGERVIRSSGEDEEITDRNGKYADMIDNGNIESEDLGRISQGDSIVRELLNRTSSRQGSKVARSESHQLKRIGRSLRSNQISPTTIEMPQGNNQQRKKRGQNKKLKKLSSKYADQDDEERSIRLERLGHSPRLGASGQLIVSGNRELVSHTLNGNPAHYESLSPELKVLEDSDGGNDPLMSPNIDSQISVDSLYNATIHPVGSTDSAALIRAARLAAGLSESFIFEDVDDNPDEVIEEFIPERDENNGAEGLPLDGELMNGAKYGESHDKRCRETVPPEDENFNVAEPPANISEVFDCLTGSPLPNDTILYALPICAPWRVVQNHTFRAKVVPGPQKKGKASHQALEGFLRQRASPREIEVLRAVPDIELVNAMLGNVKISIVPPSDKSHARRTDL